MTALVALAGRPNTGKTTLFNALTGLRQRVANFAGTTVEKAVGLVEEDGASYEVVDLPGTFSIAPVSEDERVVRRFLAEASSGGRDLLVLCVAEASNLTGDLALALSLKACGLRTALVVNMIDEARLNGVEVDAAALSRALGLRVFLVSARLGEGLAPLRAFLAGPPPPAPDASLELGAAASEALHRLHESALREAEEAANRSVRLPRGALLRTVERSIRIDRWLLHPLAGPAVLVGVLFILFQALFAVGGPLGEALGTGLARLAGALRPHIPFPLLASLVCDGTVAGVSAVIGFLPQIALLFTLIGLLEASGYLPRAGAMLERLLRPFGLDGKVLLPFLSSFACAIPGVMAARTIPDEKRRLAAILLAPLMTCSARLPVYALVIAAFIPASFRPWGLSGQGLVMAGMYAFGVLTALLLALLLRATPLLSSPLSAVTVLPPYRFPGGRELGLYVWMRCRHFLLRAGKVIFALSLVLWALGSFPRRQPPPGLTPNEAASAQLEGSLLGSLGKAVEPAFAPLGFDWRLSVAVLSSLAAREVFVGTLGTLYALGGEGEPSEGLVQALRRARTPEGLPRYGLATGVSLLLFFAVALQCVSTIAVVRRETGGWRWPAVQFACLFALAYSLSWSAYRLTLWLGA